jgi:carbamate kinase
MVVLSCFINPLDIVKIQDVEKETKEAMCVCGGGGGMPVPNIAKAQIAKLTQLSMQN